MAWNQIASHESHPWLADKRSEVPLARRVGIAMLVIGCLVHALSLWHPDRTPGIEDWGPSAGLLAYALMVLLIGSRARELLTALPIFGALAIGMIIRYTTPLDAASLFYVWPVLFAAYFLGCRWLAATLVVSAISLAFGLTAYPFDSSYINIYLQTMVTIAGAGALVYLLRERQAQLGRDLVDNANVDAVTGLLNRRAFDALLDWACGVADRFGDDLTVVIFDFESIHEAIEARGQQAGESLLAEVATTFKREMRTSDLVARFDGTAFVVLLIRCDLADSHIVCGRMQQALRAFDHGYKVDCGIAEYVRGVMTSADLMIAAERALRSARVVAVEEVLSDDSLTAA